MTSTLFSHLRSGLLAAGLLAGLSAPAMAGPAGYLAAPLASASTEAVVPSGESVRPTLVAQCRPGRCPNGARMYRRHRNDGPGFSRRNWDNRRNWNNGPRYSSRNWDNDGPRHWRKHRPHRRHHHGPQIYFGLGIVPAYRYVDPYRYVEPRRIYRSGRFSEAHVAWCYDRWRSYRAWDNTYQPYYGPRRQCLSPYS